jgi:hypothetical protein
MDRVTESFYAWEVRGRGWTLAPYPVDLEPPHRPFFVLPDPTAVALASIDDGKRPTLVSSLIDGVQRLFAPRPSQTAIAASTPWEEQEPFPLDIDSAADTALVSLRVSVPHDFASDLALASAIIRSLLRSSRPSAFEVVGHARSVSIQMTVPEDEASHVETMLAGFLPDATIVRSGDLLEEAWNSAQPSLVVDLGLANEFFLPITVERSFDIDPLISLVSALAQAQGNEVALLQVLFQRTGNGWPKTIRDALIDDSGEEIFLNEPQFITLAKEKTESPIVAAVLRIAVNARTAERVRTLVRGALSYVTQFERGGGNAFIPLENDGHDDDDHERALLRRESFRTGMLLSVDELAQLVHVPDRSVRDAALLRQAKRTKAAPGIAHGHELVLGANVHRGVEEFASVPSDARLAHMHVVGASGTGKSTLLINLISQDIAAGHGVLVLDPHGDLIDDLLARIPDERAEDVCLFNPADPDYAVGFNPFSAESEVEKNLIASDIVSVFRRLATSWGDAMTTVLANAALALLEHPKGGTLVELRRFLVDDAFRRSYLSAIPDPHVRFFWEKEYAVIGSRSLGPILTRLDQFLRPKLLRQVLGQQGGKLDMGQVVSERRILLAKLSQGEIGTENAHLLGSLLITKVHQVALGRQRFPQSARHPFYCYVDECQHFVTESMASLLSEARKYGVGFTLAHQSLAQLAGSPGVEGALLGNAFTRIAFRSSDDDAKKLAEGCSFFEANDLRSLARGEAIVRLGSSAHDFNLHVFPNAVVAANDADDARARIRALSNASFACARADLIDVLPAPTQEAPPVTAAHVGIGSVVTPPQAAATALPEPPSEAPLPIPRTKRVVEAAELPMPGRGGKEHKYLQHLIKRLAEERGFRASIEDAAAEGRADVLLRRDALIVGCEISITTNAAHELENIRKCLSAGCTRVLFIAPEKKQRDRVRALVGKEMPGQPVSVIGPEEIVTELDSFGAVAQTTESVVRGYKVKVTRQQLSPEDETLRRKAVAGVIARTLGK